MTKKDIIVLVLGLAAVAVAYAIALTPSLRGDTIFIGGLLLNVSGYVAATYPIWRRTIARVKGGDE